MLGVGEKFERLFRIKLILPSRVCQAKVKPLDDYSITTWHKHMGHIRKSNISKLQEVAEGMIPIEKVDHRVSYFQGNSFSPSSSRSKDILEAIHSDVMGPFEVDWLVKMCLRIY